MTDAEYLFKLTERERKRIARGEITISPLAEEYEQWRKE